MYKITNAKTPKINYPTDTLAEILAITFAGNWRDDAEKFERIERFMLRPDITIEERWKADFHANFNGMGMNVEYPDGEYYRDYVTNNGDRT